MNRFRVNRLSCRRHCRVRCLRCLLHRLPSCHGQRLSSSVGTFGKGRNWAKVGQVARMLRQTEYQVKGECHAMPCQGKSRIIPSIINNNNNNNIHNKNNNNNIFIILFWQLGKTLTPLYVNFHWPSARDLCAYICTSDRPQIEVKSSQHKTLRRDRDASLALAKRSATQRVSHHVGPSARWGIRQCPKQMICHGTATILKNLQIIITAVETMESFTN